MTSLFASPKHRLTIALAAFLAMASTPAFALDVSVAAGSGWRLGAVSYTISQDPTSQYAGFMSRLDFPVDGIAPSLLVTLDDPAGAWRLDAQGSVNVTDPTEKMVDRDWYLLDSTTPPVIFSHTVSKATGTTIDADVRFTWDLAESDVSLLGVQAGYSFTSLSRTVHGYTGYQYIYNTTDYAPDSAFDLYTVAWPDSEEVLTYQATSHALLAGAVFDHRIVDILSFRLSAAGAWVYVNDVDDHLLRTKRSTSINSGPGYAVDLWLKLEPFTASTGFASGLTFALSGSVSGYNTTGTQTQTWYGSDDPGVPAGTVQSGIAHTLSSFRSTIGVRIGYSF